MTRPPIYKNQRWNSMLDAAGVVLLLLVIGDILFYDYLEQNELLGVVLEIIEMFLVLVVFLDLIIKLSFAHKKYSFLRKNALRFAIAFPFSFFAKSLRFLGTGGIVPRVAIGEFLVNLLSMTGITKILLKVRDLIR